jgi:hypothetical protein
MPVLKYSSFYWLFYNSKAYSFKDLEIKQLLKSKSTASIQKYFIFVLSKLCMPNITSCRIIV